MAEQIYYRFEEFAWKKNNIVVDYEKIETLQWGQESWITKINGDDIFEKAPLNAKNINPLFTLLKDHWIGYNLAKEGIGKGQTGLNPEVIDKKYIKNTLKILNN